MPGIGCVSIPVVCCGGARKALGRVELSVDGKTVEVDDEVR